MKTGWCCKGDEQEKRGKGQSHRALMACTRNDRGMLGKAIRGAQCAFDLSTGVTCVWWVTVGRGKITVVVREVREVIGRVMRAGWRSELLTHASAALRAVGVCVDVKPMKRFIFLHDFSSVTIFNWAQAQRSEVRGCVKVNVRIAYLIVEGKTQEKWT